MVSIRCSTDADRAAIDSVHASAFGEASDEIIKIIGDLLADETAKPLLSLVADVDEKIVGHILFTRIAIESASEAVSAQILAPLAVKNGFQNRGIGGSLINEGLKELRDSGVALVFVLGYPEYYQKYGFQPAGERGYEAPYPIAAKNADAWMVRELKAGTIGAVRGTVRCAKSLDKPEYWQE